MKVQVVRNGELVEQGMQFRARVMHDAFGLDPKEDRDRWDDHAWHIVATVDDDVVGYYRAMQSEPHGFCTEIEFDLTPLGVPRDRVLEIGRAATDQQHPTAILGLWRAVLTLAEQLGKRWIMGTASLRVAELDVQYLSEQWRRHYGYDQGSHAVPRIPYQGHATGSDRNVPSLIKTYEKIGAVVVSDLGWDPRFQTADVVTLLDRGSISPAWRKKLIQQ